MKHPAVTRRWFLKIGSLAAGAVGLGAPSLRASSPIASDPEWRNRQPDMVYRRLGDTGLMVSAVIQGGNRIRPDNIRHVEQAVERGVNYIDTAWNYGSGESEKGVARLIRGSNRERLFVATKVSPYRLNRNEVYKRIYDELPESEQRRIDGAVEKLMEEKGVLEPDYLIEPVVGKTGQIRDCYRSMIMEPRYGDRVDRSREYRQLILDSVHESLKRLDTDYIDVLFCPHGGTAPAELQVEELFEAFEQLKEQGKVRFLGVSTHNDPAGILRTATRSGRYDVAMVAYNFINARWLRPAIEEATRKGLGVIAMKAARPTVPQDNYPVSEERFRTLNRLVPEDLKPPLKAYLWALRDRNVTAVNSDMLDGRMVEENLGLVDRLDA